MVEMLPVEEAAFEARMAGCALIQGAVAWQHYSRAVGFMNLYTTSNSVVIAQTIDVALTAVFIVLSFSFGTE